MKRIRPLVVSLIVVGALVLTMLFNWFVLNIRPVLGLDLQGGIQVVLSAPPGTPSDVMNQALENIRNRVDALGVGEPSLSVVNNQIIVQLPSVAQGKVVQQGKQWCVTGGTGASLGCYPSEAAAQAVLQQTGQDRLIQLLGQTARLEQRPVIASISASDPAAQKPEWQVTCSSTTPTATPSPSPGKKQGASSSSGKQQGASPSPGPTASPSKRRAAGPSAAPSPTSKKSGKKQATPTPIATPSPGAAPVPAVSPSPVPDSAVALLTPECQFNALKDKNVVFMSQDGTTIYQLGPVAVTGDMISKATAVYTSPTQNNPTAVPGWKIEFNLTSQGSAAFGAITDKLKPDPATGAPGKQLAIVVDQKVISAPQVQGKITGSGEITLGSAPNPEQEAKDLATQLNAGALPTELSQQNVETVSATLGKASLHQGLLAGLVGLVALALYLLFYYRLLGLVTWAGMGIWAILAMGLVSLAGKFFGYALTLAGVAGLIVSLGITADSYIVFYERLKDDVRHGKTSRAAVQPAFKRAWRTIVAADVVTMLAAGVLYIVAVSSVRGFALTLGLATMLDMFVVYFFKRPTVFLIARSNRLVNMPGMGLTSGVAADPDAPKAGA